MFSWVAYDFVEIFPYSEWGPPRFGTMPTDILCHSSWPSTLRMGNGAESTEKLESWRAFYMLVCGEDGGAARMGLLSRHADPERFRIRSSIKS